MYKLNKFVNDKMNLYSSFFFYKYFLSFFFLFRFSPFKWDWHINYLTGYPLSVVKICVITYKKRKNTKKKKLEPVNWPERGLQQKCNNN